MKYCKRLVLSMLLSVLTIASGCTTLPQNEMGWLPDTARSAPLRHVVVTVHNEVTSPAALGVGSTPRGYNNVASYAASPDARNQAHSLAERYRLRTVAAWPIAVLSVYCLVYRIPEDADRDIVLAQLKQDSRVESAQPLETFNTQSQSSMGARYNDTYASLQRNLDELAVPQAQQWSRGEGVRVAVIDTGVATDHADLQGRVAEWRNFVDRDAGRFRSDRHGTAVAGVIAAVAHNGLGIVGIAPEVRVLAYKACWESDESRNAVCNTFTLAQALAAAIEARADIVNLSLAGPGDPLLSRLVRSGQRAGIIFVGAAPPVADGQSPKPGFPVDVEGVIGVEAAESAGPARGLIAAPGEDIFTLTPGNHYDAASGNSLAAAEVSAMIALLRAHDSRLDSTHARNLLQGSLRPVSTAVGTRSAINVCAAIAALAPRMSCIDTGAAENARHARKRAAAMLSSSQPSAR